MIKKKYPVRLNTAFSRWYAKIAALCVIISLVTQVSAQETLPVTSLGEAFERAAVRLPEKAAQSERSAQVEAQRKAARSPFVGPAVTRSDVLTRSGGIIEQESSVSAAFKWPKEASAGVNAAKRGGDAATAAVASAQLVLAGELRVAWWRFAKAKAVAEISQNQLATAQTEAEQMARLVQAGVQSRRDLLASKAELATVMGRLSDVETELADAEAELRALIDTLPQRLADEALSAPSDIENHPLLLAAKAKSAAANASAAYLHFATRPRLEGSVGIRRERADPRGSYSNALLLGITMPFGRDSRAIADAAGMKAEASLSEAEATRLRASLIAEQGAATRRKALSERRLIESEARYAASREVLALTAKGRAEGEIGYIEYLRARQALFDAELDIASARIAKSAAISNVNQAMGVLP
jgi:outer membrane protein, heavy metal efflux system